MSERETMTMVERVARAIYDATPFKETEGGYEAQSDTYKRMCRLLSRAAIEAMWEPTDSMFDAAKPYNGCASSVHDMWRDMIDAAIGEEYP